MPPIRIDVQILGEEAILRLDSLPRRLREALTKKMLEAMGTVKSELLYDTPGRYLDPKYIKSEVTQSGDLLVGTVEAEDKPGVYSIYPTKANVLRFISKDGDVVFARRVLYHPFLKAGPIVERYFRDHKPWLIEQIEDAVFDVVYK